MPTTVDEYDLTCNEVTAEQKQHSLGYVVKGAVGVQRIGVCESLPRSVAPGFPNRSK